MTLCARSWWGALGLALLLLLTLSAGCAKERGSTYRCTCSYLTDFDDGSTADVLVCSPTDERAPDFARGCAQLGAPAPVEKCSCRMETSKTSCEAGTCTNLPRQ